MRDTPAGVGEHCATSEREAISERTKAALAASQASRHSEISRFFFGVGAAISASPLCIR
jgi:hypothetical protein